MVKYGLTKISSACSAFLYNAMQEKNSDELGNIQLTIKTKALEAVKPLVKETLKTKYLNKDIVGQFHF
ncbi:MAG: hypothetical protein R2777_04865 [Chitinophagales bacterium]